MTLAAVAPHAAQASELQRHDLIRNTDLAEAGYGGMRGNGTGTLTVRGISGAVTKALLYWQGPTNTGGPSANGTVSFAGTSVTGTQIGFSDDNCWGFVNSQGYRADVTSLVSGDGTYALSNFAKPGFADVNGASLLVFYRDADTSNDRDVAVFDGNDSNVDNGFDASGWNASLTNVPYASGSASLRLHVSDGQQLSTNIGPDPQLIVNDTVLAPAGPIFEGDSVPRNTDVEGLWDIKAFDVTRLLTPGSNSLSLRSPSPATPGDCLGLIVAAVDVGATEPLPPPPPPPPVEPPPPPPPPPPPVDDTPQSTLPPHILVADSIDQLPDPTPFMETNVQPEGRGPVFVQLPGRVSTSALRAAQAQGAPRGFLALQQAAQLPIGTIVETTNGKVIVESAANIRGSRTQTARFDSGRFQMLQKRIRRGTPITEMVLKGGSFRGCPRARQSASWSRANDAQRRRRNSRVRRLWGNGRGRFRTRGRYSSATVRGTKWLVEDRCNGTLTRLPRRPRTSVVDVRDLSRRRTIRLRAGRSYLARPRVSRSR